MEEDGSVLINFNKGEDDEGCLKFCNILKWSATVQGKLLKGCLEITVRYDSITAHILSCNIFKISRIISTK
jgi:hypothetical protein